MKKGAAPAAPFVFAEKLPSWEVRNAERLRIAILEYSRTIAGRQFLGMTQETLETLRERVEREGAP